MNYRKFVGESGFKILALARLSQCGYSVVLYLLNCAVSGLDQVVTTEMELAHSLGYEENEIHKTLRDLDSRSIIRLFYGDVVGHPENTSLRISMQFEVKRWVMDFDHDVTSKDAIVYPFRIQGISTLALFEGQGKGKGSKADRAPEPTWRRVLQSFTDGRSFDEDELSKAEDDAKVLIDTHPVDQVLLMIRHFQTRIPTLSLLASAWQHFQELYESETHRVDLLDARQKHVELDDKVRSKAKAITDDEKLDLSEEERTVLKILANHRHPRRQLFWAYQLKNRYPNLSAFFDEHLSIMLPVTSAGTVVKRPPSQHE